MIYIKEHHSVNELVGSKDFDDLVHEYATCNRMPNTDAVKNFDLTAYQMLGEDVIIGLLMDDDKMAGLIVLLPQIHLHTNSLLMYVDSLYIKPEYRKNGNFVKLMNWAKEYTRAQGFPNLICSAYHGTELEKVFFRKYNPLETWFSVEI